MVMVAALTLGDIAVYNMDSKQVATIIGIYRRYDVMHRLIIVEGLPCSGKSTTSKYIADSIGAKFYDEGSGNHPADYEFHSFIKNKELCSFLPEEQVLIKQNAVSKADGYIISLSLFSGELFDKLLQHKIYDFLLGKLKSLLCWINGQNLSMRLNRINNMCLTAYYCRIQCVKQ